MSIKDRISNDLKDAMRARDKMKLDALRLITAAVKQVEVDERIAVDDERMLVILDKMAKQRKESIAQFNTAGRHDLVAQEQFELDLINQYLPEPLSEDEVNQLISQAIAEVNAEKMSDMGKVMAHLKPQLQGRADMSKVSALIKTKLS
ncbi:GatB/YqeY domain-containing protein [Legionella taurinensis]|uniref:GatB/YqeY domain-containing protein n=1 Tax=Legionella taurinensis TaxID=70611 RepID=A0A3A5L851_9GAMM|nr:GatB/YqeY domain-containing protein [Legionella taurinensis]MDX1837663.1 GatB/YqeY domain-containing protein [Legionella taurinensis]PUT40044.1 glutamyl-tRNA amidotransferase [Legionella taurinensis]PUT43810.1 glutamyl-tRNA amidotransferase [Legionella taurinensis]PUT46234.1 glutamyl-tRNA amidotransferase [Legionella taurinensis]PUT47965.1 glutamyl-tRNA amidotransferase [Legionella taurinensis]